MLYPMNGYSQFPNPNQGQNPNDILIRAQQFRQNPWPMLQQTFNVPQGINTQEGVLQYLLNTGKVNQAQVNNVMQFCMGMQSNPNPMMQNLLNIFR